MRKIDQITEEDGDENCDVMKNIPDNSTQADKQSLTAQEVRQGHTGDHVRYILLASIVGAIFVMGWLLLAF